MTVWHVLLFISGAILTVWSMSYLQTRSRPIGRRPAGEILGAAELDHPPQPIRRRIAKSRAWLASTRRLLLLRAVAFRKNRTGNRSAKRRPLRCPKLPSNRLLINAFKRKRTQPLG